MSEREYYYATGRRKTSSARVFLRPSQSEEEGGINFIVNGQPIEEYLPIDNHQKEVLKPFQITDRFGTWDVYSTVKGGGVKGQTAALRHGIARALEESEPELRSALKSSGLLSRDPRMVERKKPGRHKARKKPQFSKR